MGRPASLTPPPGGYGMPRRRRRRRRISRRVLMWVGGGVAAVVLLPFAVFGILIAMIDPNAYKAQIEASVRQALGRELQINGAITVSASLSPKLVLNDLTLSNVAGGSRPDMVRVEQAEVELAPRALLTGRFVIARMALLRPDILLETTTAGEDNWRFDRAAGSPAAASPATSPGAAAPPALDSADMPRLSLQTVHVRDATLTWSDRRTGRILVFEIPRISATAATADSPVSLGAELVIGRQHVLLSAQTGPLGRLPTASVQEPWGMFGTLETSGAKLTVAGSLTRPLEGRGYSLRVDGTVLDLSLLSWLSPVRLPPLHNLSFNARVLDQGGVLPDISQVTIKTGLTNLDQISPGFTLDTARIDMPRLTEPMSVTAEGNFAGTTLHVGGTVGPLSLLLPGARTGDPFTVDVTAEAGGATFGVRGVITAPTRRTGMDLAIGARVPDLSVLSPLYGRPLPPLKTIAFSGHLVDSQAGPGQGYGNGMTLRDIVLTSPQGDLAGNVTVTGGDGAAVPPALVAVLKSGKLDVDGLLAAISAGPDLYGLMPAPRDAAPVDVTAPLPVPQRSNTVIPDTSLKLDQLNRGNADVKMTVGELNAGGNTIRHLDFHLALKDAHLVIDPLTGELPGGALGGRLDVDGRQQVPPASLWLQVPGVNLQPVLQALGFGTLVGGTMELRVGLHGAGGSLHALAANLDGRVGVALNDAEIDSALLANSLATVLQMARIPGDFGNNRTKLRCVAVGIDVAHGVATLGPAVLDSDRLLFNVTGRLDLAGETLALQLRPMLRGANLVVPMRADGAFRDVRLAPDNGPPRLAAGKPAPGLEGEHGGDSCTPSLAAVHALTVAPPAAHVGQ